MIIQQDDTFSGCLAFSSKSWIVCWHSEYNTFIEIQCKRTMELVREKSGFLRDKKFEKKFTNLDHDSLE
jgi:hypothetical protein